MQQSPAFLCGLSHMENVIIQEWLIDSSSLRTPPGLALTWIHTHMHTNLWSFPVPDDRGQDVEGGTQSRHFCGDVYSAPTAASRSIPSPFESLERVQSGTRDNRD